LGQACRPVSLLAADGSHVFCPHGRLYPFFESNHDGRQ
jgi:hypothetical protein